MVLCDDGPQYYHLLVDILDAKFVYSKAEFGAWSRSKDSADSHLFIACLLDLCMLICTLQLAPVIILSYFAIFYHWVSIVDR